LELLPETAEVEALAKAEARAQEELESRLAALENSSPPECWMLHNQGGSRRE